jgi:hypothetical protein
MPTILALAIYPAAVTLAFLLNPIEVCWGSYLAKRGRPFGDSMPRALKDRADAATRYLNFVADALILGSIAFLSHKVSISPARMGLQMVNWKRDAIVGVAAGAAAIAIMGLMLRKIPIDPLHNFTYQARKGSPLLWVSIFMSASFSEELWIAFCLRASAYPTLVSVAMIVAIFAAMHFSYGFWGTIGVAAKATVSALLFLHFGSLVVTSSYHFVSNLGSFYWNRYWRR